MTCEDYTTLLAECDRLRAIERLALDWKQGHEWVKQNPGKLLSSVMTGDEAAETMREYFAKEAALLAALAPAGPRGPA